MDTDQSYENRLMEEEYIEFIARKLEETEEQTRLLQEDSPGSPEIYRYLTLTLELRKQLEVVRIQNKKNVDKLFLFIDEVKKGIEKTVSNPFVRNNPDELPKHVQGVLMDAAEKFDRTVNEQRKRMLRAKVKNG